MKQNISEEEKDKGVMILFYCSGFYIKLDLKRTRLLLIGTIATEGIKNITLVIVK